MPMSKRTSWPMGRMQCSVTSLFTSYTEGMGSIPDLRSVVARKLINIRVSVKPAGQCVHTSHTVCTCTLPHIQRDEFWDIWRWSLLSPAQCIDPLWTCVYSKHSSRMKHILGWHKVKGTRQYADLSGVRSFSFLPFLPFLPFFYRAPFS